MPANDCVYSRERKIRGRRASPRAKQIAPTPRHRHRDSRDLFRGCENISFSVSTTVKAYNLMHHVGRAIAFILQVDQSKHNLTGCCRECENPEFNSLNEEKMVYVCMPSTESISMPRQHRQRDSHLLFECMPL